MMILCLMCVYILTTYLCDTVVLNAKLHLLKTLPWIQRGYVKEQNLRIGPIQCSLFAKSSHASGSERSRYFSYNILQILFTDVSMNLSKKVLRTWVTAYHQMTRMFVSSLNRYTGTLFFKLGVVYLSEWIDNHLHYHCWSQNNLWFARWKSRSIYLHTHCIIKQI